MAANAAADMHVLQLARHTVLATDTSAGDDIKLYEASVSCEVLDT